MFKLMIMSIFIVIVVADYQFQDPDFNQLLYDDLTANEDEADPARLKRGTTNLDHVECKHKSSKKEKEAHCCNGDMSNLRELDTFKAVKKNCIDESRNTNDNEITFDPLSCEGVVAMRQQMACAAECLAKKYGLLEENGEFNQLALLNYTRSVVGINKWKADAAEEYVSSCLDELKAAKNVNIRNGSKDAMCDSKILEFHHCIWRKFVKGCPADLQIQSKKCKKIRARLVNDNNSYGDTFYKTSSNKHSRKSLLHK